MPHYRVVILPEAEKDINNTYYYIADSLFQRETADKYMDGIYKTIDRLALYDGILAVSTNENLRRLYGHEVRTIIYKKMTIIYTVANDVVLVHRVVASSLIV